MEPSNQTSSDEHPDLHLAAARTQLEGVTVLVVDDQPDAREALQLLLESEGAGVLAADSAAAAMGVVATEHPDVMIVDLAMPVVDGFTLVEQLRLRPEAEGGSVPAIALTGYVSSVDRDRAARAGFQEYLVKPVEPVDLIRVLKRLARPVVDDTVNAKPA